MEFAEGIDLFNAEDYYRAHECWEVMWRDAEEEKKFLQGLIQIAAGYHHHLSGNAEGAVLMLTRGLAYLMPYPELYQGIDAGQLRRDVAESLQRIRERSAFNFPKIVKKH